MENWIVFCVYVLMCAMTYLSQKWLLTIDKDAPHYPHGLMVVLIFVPFLGLAISVLMLIVELFSKRYFDFKKFYRIK